MFTVKIDTDNAAFEDSDAEVGRILGEVVKMLENGRRSGRCIDINGNKVGTWGFGNEAEGS